MDTQADISVLKENVLKENSNFNHLDTIKIRGITNNAIYSLGTIETDLIIDDFAINHTFHVVPEEFYIPSDGILGKDFIKNFKCHLDYNKMTLSFSLNNEKIIIPILQGPEQDTIILPARCEVI